MWEGIVRELDQGVSNITVVHAQLLEAGALTEIPDFILQFVSLEEALVVNLLSWLKVRLDGNLFLNRLSAWASLACHGGVNETKS